MPKNVVCPFYQYDQGVTIKCEGMKVVFNTAEELRDYRTKYCGDLDNYKNCALALRINERYEDDDYECKTN